MFAIRVDIENINGIKSLSIPLHRYMNLICGPNGIGKSTILDSIAATFSHGSQAAIKRHANSEGGKITVITSSEIEPELISSVSVDGFHPNIDSNIAGAYTLSKYIFSLKTTRTFSYRALESISKDPVRDDGTSFTAAQTGLQLFDTKNWFVNRFMFFPHKGSLNGAQIANFELAKECFSVLNPDFTFHTVDASTNEILINTPTGILYYEYLSSGFKSCLSIMFGLFKEIEYRFPGVKAGEMEAIVLIDEIDLHLHPAWQATIASALQKIFASIQFIASTHSPHVIQNSEPNTVIALEAIEAHDGAVQVRELAATAKSFKGWTIEEVLEDVMGMPDTRTAFFNEISDDFGDAIDSENIERAKALYEEIDTLLHPNNPYRKIARLQLASLGVKID